MKKLSSPLLLLLAFVLVLCSMGNARANRAAAGDISYKWVSDSTYLLTYTLYTDCIGDPRPATVNLCYYNGCNSDKGNISLAMKTPVSSNGQPVASSCAGASSTTCSTPAGTLRGYRKWEYEGLVKLPSRCASWRFIVSLGGRNNGISNYAIPAASNNLFSETTLNNIDGATSSSPSFNLGLIQYMCAGVKQSYSFKGTDPDGDDITYTLIDPTTAADNQVACVIPPAGTSYVFGGPPATMGTFLGINPFATDNTFDLNPISGSMTFTPTTALDQQPLMTILVTKRRGGTVISTMTRDVQFVISGTCTPFVVDFAYDKTSSSQVLWSLTPVDTAIVCPMSPHKICFTISSPDPMVTISNITDNHTTFSNTSGTSTLPSPYTGEGTNTVSNCFEWTPEKEDGGVKYLIINSEVCKPGSPKLFRTDSIVIDVIKTISARAIDTFICFGGVTTICQVDGTGPFSWCSTTPGSGTCLSTLYITTPNDPCTDVNPLETTTYLLVDSAIRGICPRKDILGLNSNQTEIKIVVVNPKIDAGPDTTMCSYSELRMNANLPASSRQPELTYKFSWSPGKWLDDSTSATPLLSFPPSRVDIDDIPNDITFYLTCIPYPDTTCKKVDTVKVDILKGFYILTGDTLAGPTGLGHRGRQKGVSDTSICERGSITLQGWGDPRYNYIWNPASGVSTPTNYLPGTTTITPTGTMTYAVTAMRSGCEDSTKVINITVEPLPIVDIGPDQTICFGDTINLYAEITPDVETFTQYTYEWAPGGALARADTFFTYFTGYRTEKIVFTVKTPAGCTGKDSAIYTVEPRLFLTASPDTAICPGDTVQISVAGDGLLKSVTWKPLTNLDSLHSLRPKVAPVYNTDYVVIGIDSNSCIDSATVRVSVHPRALIYLPDSATIYPGDTYQLDPEGNSLYYTWFPPIGLDFADIANPKARPLLNTTYTVKGVTDAGCVAVDSIYIFVAPDSYIDMPNAFVPGRGENNVFRPVHLGNATLKSFSIYNRWGMKMFESTDINQGWDGTYSGQPQPFGVYVYILEAVTANGRLITKQGNVTLVR